MTIRIYCEFCDSYTEFLVVENGPLLCEHCGCPLEWLVIMGPWLEGSEVR